MLTVQARRTSAALVRVIAALLLAVGSLPVVDGRLLPTPVALAAGYTVNDLSDAGDGTCDDTCTLRDAILAANASGGADTIDFSASGAIVLGATLPAITDTLTIDGSGQTVAVDGANSYRVFTTTAPVTLTALTVQHSNAGSDGGGAFFGAATVLNGMTFFRNTVSGSNSGGSGAYFADSATINNSSFISNTTDAYGGGAYFADVATVSGTTFLSNTAVNVGGGAVFVGQAIITATTFLSNVASSGGGANFLGSAMVTATTFQGNGAASLGGGAYFGVAATTAGTTFDSNTAESDGGGAYFANQATVIDTTFIGNKADSNGGARFTGRAVVSGSTFSNNTARAGSSGGAGFAGVSTITGTTFVSNTAINNGGSAVFNDQAIITNTTFMSSTAGNNGGGGMFFNLATLSAVSFISNTTTGGYGGGATFFDAARLTGGLFSRNQVLNSNQAGGGAYFVGAAVLTDTSFISNTAGINGGGARFGAAATVVGGTFAGNDVSENDAHGGGATFDSIAVITGTRFAENQATFGKGGGAFFAGTAVLTATSFLTNHASSGGGAYFSSTAQLLNPSFVGNTAGGGVGGAYFWGTTAVTGGLFSHNSTTSSGGGALFRGPANVTGTVFYRNSSSFGGGVFVVGPTAVLRNLLVLTNTATFAGAAVYFGEGVQAILENSVLADNYVTDPEEQSVVKVNSATTQLVGRHNTLVAIAPNTTVAVGVSLSATATLTNTLFDGFEIGLLASTGAQASLDGVLWSSITTLTQGTGISVTQAVSGAAAFADAAADDYHLTLASAALDAGMPTSLNVDFEGDPRPVGAAPDLGADEYIASIPTAPTAADDSASTPEDTPILLSVLSNDSDPNSDALTISAVGLPNVGNVAAVNAATQVAYTPSLNFNGETVFTYTVTDGTFFATGRVTVTVTPVNDNPTVTAPADLIILVNSSIGPLPFTVDDTEQGGAVTVTASSSNQALVPDVSILLGGSGLSRTVMVTPTAGMTGAVTITLVVDDGAGGMAQDSFVLTVKPYALYLPLAIGLESPPTGNRRPARGVLEA